jgi:hypothetical protein
MRALIILTISFATLSLAAPSRVLANPEGRQPSKIDNVRSYGKSVVGRRALIGSAASAGIGQARNSPHEWGRGPAGFAKRFGSSLATGAVKQGIERGVGGILHEDQKNYVRADRPGFVPKFKSAAENTFWVRHKSSSKRYPAVGRFSGAFGAGMVSRLWQPARLHTVASGAATGGIILGADFGMNLAREYMPDHRKHIARGQ